MMMKFKRPWLCLLCALAALLAGCGDGTAPAPRTVRVVLEEGPGYSVQARVWDIPAGETLDIPVTPLDGWRVTGCDYPGAMCEPLSDGSAMISLPEVRYSTVVTVAAEENPFHIRYHDGDFCEEMTYPATHLRVNTAIRADIEALISEDGTRLLCGWNTRADFTGECIGLGSRVEVERGAPLELYAQWVPFADAACFDWEIDAAGGAVVTGYHGRDAVLSIPARLDGHPVSGIAESAFEAADCRCVILPPTLRTVAPRAFEGCSLQTLVFFDTLQSVTDYAFSGCAQLREIRINAARPPVYSGSYFDTFCDKLDRLRAIAHQPKIILFSGSSTRFGYDSGMIDAAFPEFEVVNMGVFAYTNALPQFDLILRFAQSGDILVHSPEFDAVQRQFAVSNGIDASFFAMIESDYGILRLLDYRDYGGLLSAFTTFQKNRSGMTPGDYRLSPSEFDEEHRRVTMPSYNIYGDYVVHRPNAADDAPVYALPVDYLAEAFPENTVIAPLNKVYRRFQNKGVGVFFTYAPRNRLAVSERSDESARRRLDKWLREKLCAPVISEIEGSLYPGHLLYGTDNHLSTEGVALRTARFIRDLRRQFEREGRP